MGDVVTLKKLRPKDKHKGKTLSKTAYHKWDVVQGNPFDVKQGKMVTRYRCARCGTTRTEAR